MTHSNKKLHTVYIHDIFSAGHASRHRVIDAKAKNRRVTRCWEFLKIDSLLGDATKICREFPTFIRWHLPPNSPHHSIPFPTSTRHPIPPQPLTYGLAPPQVGRGDVGCQWGWRMTASRRAERLTAMTAGRRRESLTAMTAVGEGRV